MGLFVFSGCLSESSPSGDAQLSIKMSVKDLDKSGNQKGLGKGSVIKLKKLVVTLTSSHPGDTAVIDTVLASDTGGSSFVSNSSTGRSSSRRWTPVIRSSIATALSRRAFWRARPGLSP
jgi:hypothetical protein